MQPIINKTAKMSSTLGTGGRLLGKVAIVTGSTEGIGLAIARKLGREGAAVVVSSRKQEKVDSAVEQLKKENIKVTGHACHVAKQEQRGALIEHALSEFGGVDILVPNAASNLHYGPILECTEDRWDKMFDTNVKSTFFLCKEVIPHMEKRGNGSIVIVSSVVGYFTFFHSTNIAPYSITKTALFGVVKGLVPDCAKRNIRVNSIAPGIIKTKFSTGLWQGTDNEDKEPTDIALNRFGTPDECAGAVAFLASDEASYITGENLVVAGGAPSAL